MLSMYLGKREPFHELVLVTKIQQIPFCCFLTMALVPAKVPVRIQLLFQLPYAQPIGDAPLGRSIIFRMERSCNKSGMMGSASMLATKRRNSAGEQTQPPAP